MVSNRDERNWRVKVPLTCLIDYPRPHKNVWHGAKMDSIDSNCDDWHVSSPDRVGLGSSLLGNKLLDQGNERWVCWFHD